MPFHRVRACNRRLTAMPLLSTGENLEAGGRLDAGGAETRIVAGSGNCNAATGGNTNKRSSPPSSTAMWSSEYFKKGMTKRLGLPFAVCSLLFLLEVYFPTGSVPPPSRQASTIETKGIEYGVGGDVHYQLTQYAVANDQVVLQHFTQEQLKEQVSGECKHIAINYPEHPVLGLHQEHAKQEEGRERRQRYCSTPRARCMDHVLDCFGSNVQKRSPNFDATSFLSLQYPVDAEQHFIEIHNFINKWASSEGYDVQNWKMHHPFLEHWESRYDSLPVDGCISDVFGPYIPLLVPLFNDPYYVYDEKELRLKDLQRKDMHTQEYDIDDDNEGTSFAINYTTEEVVSATRTVVKFVNALSNVLRKDVPYIAVANDLGGTRISVMDTVFEEFPNILVLNGARNYGMHDHVAIPPIRSRKEASKFSKQDLHYRRNTNIVDRGHLLSLVLTKDDIISTEVGVGGFPNSDSTLGILFLNDRIHNSLVSLAFQYNAGRIASSGDRSNVTTNISHGSGLRRSLQAKQQIPKRERSIVGIDYEYYQSHHGYDDMGRSSNRVLYDAMFSMTTSSRGIYERLNLGLIPIYVYDNDHEISKSNVRPPKDWKLELPYSHLPIYDTEELIMKVPISELNDFVVNKLLPMTDHEIQQRENQVLRFREEYLTTANILDGIDKFMIEKSASAANTEIFSTNLLCKKQTVF